MKRAITVMAMCLIAGLVGCATPESRIKKNPELFASFPPNVQALVRNGEVAIDFTPEMVTMALGKPSRIYSRQTAGMLLEVWSYTSKSTSRDRERVQVDVRTRDIRGRLSTQSQWVYVDVPRETEYERMRIEFADDKVVAIDTLQ